MQLIMPSVVPMAARVFGKYTHISLKSIQMHMKSYLAKAISLIRSRSHPMRIFSRKPPASRVVRKGQAE